MSNKSKVSMLISQTSTHTQTHTATPDERNEPALTEHMCGTADADCKTAE